MLPFFNFLLFVMFFFCFFFFFLIFLQIYTLIHILLKNIVAKKILKVELICFIIWMVGDGKIDDGHCALQTGYIAVTYIVIPGGKGGSYWLLHNKISDQSNCPHEFLLITTFFIMPKSVLKSKNFDI